MLNNRMSIKNYFPKILSKTKHEITNKSLFQNCKSHKTKKIKYWEKVNNKLIKYKRNQYQILDTDKTIVASALDHLNKEKILKVAKENMFLISQKGSKNNQSNRKFVQLVI